MAYSTNSIAFSLQTKVEILETVCASPLGMENGKIPDSAIVASSRYSDDYGPEQGRLNNQGKVFFQNVIYYAIKLMRLG